MLVVLSTVVYVVCGLYRHIWENQLVVSISYPYLKCDRYRTHAHTVYYVHAHTVRTST